MTDQPRDFAAEAEQARVDVEVENLRLKMGIKLPLEDPNPPIPDALLERIAEEPCPSRHIETECPPCQANRELERRRAVNG